MKKKNIIMKELSGIPMKRESLQLVSDLIQDLFDEMGTEDIGEYMATSVEQGGLTEAQGSWILGVSVWVGTSNGSELCQTTAKWLREANNELRVKLALENDVIPVSQDEFISVYETIKRNFPHFSSQVDLIIKNHRPSS